MDEGRQEAVDFHDDWEILGHGSDSSRPSLEALDEESMGGDGGGMIKVDYFSARGSGFSSHGGDISESGDSAVSDKPSWIDPSSDNGRYGRKVSAELWSNDSDSSDGLPEERRFGEKVDGEGSLYKCTEREVGYEGSHGKSEGGIVLGVGVDVGEKGVRSEIRMFGDEVMMGRGDGSEVGFDDCGPTKADDEKLEDGGGNDDERRRGRVVWWKVPFELVRYYATRISNPVWTFSVAAAVVGVVMLGRKLYRTRQKTHMPQLNVKVDDKKVSSFTSRIARLNEAFSVVRHVPIIRPVLPAPGVSPWPVMSIR